MRCGEYCRLARRRRQLRDRVDLVAKLRHKSDDNVDPTSTYVDSAAAAAAVAAAVSWRPVCVQFVLIDRAPAVSLMAAANGTLSRRRISTEAHAAGGGRRSVGDVVFMRQTTPTVS